MAKEVSTMVLDDEEIMRETPLAPEVDTLLEAPKTTKRTKKQAEEIEDEPISCLRNERVIVRFVPKQTGLVSNPKHILYGGMAEAAVRWFTLPRLSSGMYVNALTDKEKAYLEDIMGLEYNALSIYKKVDNFWDNLTVRLTKQDNFLNLADPEDYIKYKILLANKDYIASSLQELQDKPKATYQFVIVQEGEETKNAKKEMNATMQSYMKFGEIQEDAAKLRVIIETIDGRPLAKTTKIEFLHEKINKLIQADPKLFLRVAEDPYLDTKVLIKRAIEGGLISNRGGMLYLKSDGTPLCGDNEEPTLSVAAKFLSAPKRQELKFSLEAKLKE
jgi:hypothetical protein|nr:MAG TPA: hypothetical protein [Crassvirales sp.]